MEKTQIKPLILLTGSTGFIGCMIYDYFSQLGYEVHRTDVKIDHNPAKHQYRSDIRQISDLQKNLPLLESPIIIHTAGIIDSALPKKLMFDVNVQGTHNILEYAKWVRCSHFIQLSSVSVYGYNLLGENRSEDQTHRCKYIGINYSKSKAEAERKIEKSGIPYSLLRFPPVLGENDSYITPTIVPRLLEGNLFFGSREDHMYSLFYVKNMGSLLESLINHGPLNDAVNCIDYTVPWREYCGEYARQLHVDMPLQVKPFITGLLNWEDKHYLLMIGYSGLGASYTNEKLQTALHWNPPFHWHEGVREAISSFMKAHPEYVVLVGKTADQSILKSPVSMVSNSPSK